MQFRRLFAWLFLISVAVSSVWMLWILYVHKHQSKLRVDVLDIGQGDAILITTPNQTRLLIDTGPNQQVIQALGDALPLHVRNLDAVLLTHPDLDHIGGTVDVFSFYTVPLLITASSSKETDVTRAVDEIPVNRSVVYRGDRIVLDVHHNIYADILAPDISWHPEDANDSSIVLKLVYGETCFILTGDASVNVEQALVHMYGDTLDCDVLKAGHHGSRTSTSASFVGTVSPSYAAISAGKDSDFGHPHQEVLDILSKFNVEILRTDEQGTISFVSDGKVVSLKKNRR
jgi:competence protein ComEC